MILIPAIDIKDGKCVRLRQGKMDDTTVFSDNPVEMARVMKAIRYQLQERVQFVKPTDPIVAQLLFDLSNLVALNYSLNDALELSQLSLRYNYNQTGSFYKILNKRHAFYFNQTSDTIGASIKRNKTMFLVIGVILLGILAIPLKFFLDDAREEAAKSGS